MKGVYSQKKLKHGQGVTCFGYYSEDGRLRERAERLGEPGGDSNQGGSSYEELVEQDEAYRVEVFRDLDGAHYVRLRSDSRHAAAKVEGRLDTHRSGLESTLAMGTDEPELPQRYQDSDRAIEMYAEYALEHGAGAGVSGEFDWDGILEEGTR